MTTPKLNSSLSQIFDIELTQTDKPLAELKVAAKVDSIDSVERQREYVKANLVELIEKGKVALENLTQIAISTEKSKDFDSMSTMIKTLVDTNMTLLECEIAAVKPQDKSSGTDQPSVTNNTAVFVGSTSDLSKHIKEVTLNAIPNRSSDN